MPTTTRTPKFGRSGFPSKLLIRQCQPQPVNRHCSGYEVVLSGHDPVIKMNFHCFENKSHCFPCHPVMIRMCYCILYCFTGNRSVMTTFQIWDQLPNVKAVIQYSGELEDKSNPNVYTVNMRFYFKLFKTFCKLKIILLHPSSFINLK